MPRRSTTRVRLTREQQRELFAHHTANDKTSLRELSQWAATRFRLAKAPSPSSVSDMLKRCRAEADESANALEARLSHSLEYKLVQWIAHCEGLGMHLMGTLICSKAELIRDAMLVEGVPSPLDEKLRKLTFSNGWLYKFQLRSKLLPSRQKDGDGGMDKEHADGESDDESDIRENDDEDEKEAN